MGENQGKWGEMGGNGGTWRNLKEIRGGNGRKSGGDKIKLKELGGTWRKSGGETGENQG